MEKDRTGKISAYIESIIKDCKNLVKITNPEDKIEREYSILAQKIIGQYESLIKKQKERQQREEEKLEKAKNKILHGLLKKDKPKKKKKRSD
jgi:hypothetical protein